MEIYILIIISLFLLFLVYFGWIFLNFKISQSNESEFVVLNYTIGLILENYKSVYFNNNVNNLTEKHDLKEGSPTNSSKLYRDEYEKLVHSSAKEVISVHMSQNMKKIAFKYYTLDSLLLHVINLLRS